MNTTLVSPVHRKGMEPVVPPSTHRIFVGSEKCVDAVAGDLVLVRHAGIKQAGLHGFVPSGIRFFERLWCPPYVDRADWKDFCSANHAAIVLSGGPTALVVQAEWKGLVITPLNAMAAESFAVVSYESSPSQRAAVVAFAHDSIGWNYGKLQILADAFNAVTRQELSLGAGNASVCSTAACRALERTDFVPDRPASAVVPAHLAAWFNVKLPIPA